VAKQIGQCGYRTAVLHSNRTQGQRQRALDGFRRGEFQLLVATDIAARGLDIETISHVINYDIPDTVDAYIHRIGRTGRAERNGDALTLVTADDRATVRDIERHLGSSIDVQKVEGFDFGPVTLAEGGRGTAPTSWHNSGGGPRRAGSWPLNKGGLRRAANRRAH
jgi:ATP-dependent RNA helicase RhlE